ncbi:hypothetical protein [Botryobacter ruber]|uniref:hypothetical protein n=1 Tax=Botryobacter ruber TaxID=2171629 RepID=UPI000E0BADE7|nr:hypothetical protein [Botryobacter ruber]
MLHFSKITTPGKDFNLIASGALAYKIHNKILKDEEFRQYATIARNMHYASTSPAGNNIFFVIISDLDKINTESLCHMIAKERQKGGYAVCEVIPMLYNEVSFKALTLLQQTFNEVLELGKFNLGSSKALINAEQQNCVITDYSLSMVRLIYNLCLTNTTASTRKTEKENLALAG